jgi:DNA mismatch endonuclease (patch repair protein)
MPKSNVDFWREKLSKNVGRDASNQEELRLKGWSMLTVWECEVNDSNLQIRLADFLEKS